MPNRSKLEDETEHKVAERWKRTQIECFSIIDGKRMNEWMNDIHHALTHILACGIGHRLHIGSTYCYLPKAVAAGSVSAHTALTHTNIEQFTHTHACRTANRN